MEELQAQLDAVNTQIAEEQAKGPQRDADVIANLEQKQQVILIKIDDAKAQKEQADAQQVRIQAQEEKVDSIVLPYDFNDLFSDEDYKNAQGQPHRVSKANNMIIEVVKEFQRKAYEDHNAEIQALTDAHKEEIRASSEREVQLKRQNDELQTQLENEKESFDVQSQALVETRLRLRDAEDKRDAAVKQLEEAQAEITQLKSWNDDLRAQAAQGVRKAIDVVDISPTDKLAQMVKETNEQKANRALARWNEIMPEVVAPPVVSAGEAVFPVSDPQANDPSTELVGSENIVVPQESQVEAFRTDEGTVSREVQVADGNSAAPVAGTTLEERVAKLEATVKELCEVCNVDVAEVA